MGATTRTLLVGVVVAVVQLVTLPLGWWWATLLSGLVAGAWSGARRKGGAVLLVSVLATLLVWSAVLLWRTGGDLARSGDVAGALAFDARGMGGVVAAVTVAYGVLLVVAGHWLGWLGGSQPRTASARRSRSVGAAVEGTEDSPGRSAVTGRPHSVGEAARSRSSLAGSTWSSS